MQPFDTPWNCLHSFRRPGLGKEPAHFRPFRIGETGTEVQRPLDHACALEVIAAAAGMHESRGIEAAVLEEHQAQAPFAARDRLVALPAGGLAARTLDAIGAAQAVMLEALAGGRLECGTIQFRGSSRDRLEQRLGALVRRAER